MTDSLPKIKVCKKNKVQSLLSKDVLKKLSQEELIDKIVQLEAHNLQLKNLLKKKSEVNSVSNTTVNKKIDFNKVSKRHVLLKFYYLGWDYQGYVIQEDTNNTIEYFLFKALQKCCLIESREKSNYHRCGRTDKGVSAFCQVISIDLRSKLQEPNETNVSDEFPYCSMLNRLLPDNIRCYAWAHVGYNISARYDCSSRTYKYYFPNGDLNIKAMQEGAKFLIGTHDFRNFCKMDVGNGVTEFQRNIEFVKIVPVLPFIKGTSGYQMFEFIIKGNSYLWHQIRCIMNVLLLIGQGKESPIIIKQLLNVNENVSKPQYSLANYLPLNLHSVDFESTSTEWNINSYDLKRTIKLLQSQWANYCVKCTMITDMIDSLLKLSDVTLNIKSQAEFLQKGTKSKVHKPLLSRIKCESLENRITYYIKKRKIEVVETSCT